MMDSEKNLVASICTLAYNLENYIGACLDSLLKQETNFDFEIVIGENHSTDNTLKICEQYEQKYPEIIRIIRRESNIGMTPNYWATMQACRGKYIAILDGDDYWTDPLKLQKQVDFLEQHNDFCLVCTNYFSGSKEVKNLHSKDREIKAFDIMHHDAIGIMTAMFRSRLLPDPNQSELFQNPLFCDYPLWLELLKSGRMMKLGDYTAYYRILENSGTFRNSLPKRIQYLKGVVDVTNTYINQFDLSKKEKKQILFERYSYLIDKVKQRSKREALRYYKEYISKSPAWKQHDLKYLMAILFK